MVRYQSRSDRIDEPSLTTLGPVHALTYSSGNGQYILSGSSDRSIKLWNPIKAIESYDKTGEPYTLPIQTYTGAHIYEVLTLSVSSDNSRFLSGGGDKSVFIWDVASGKILRRLGGGPGGHNGKIESVGFGGEDDAVVVSASYDASVRLWDTKAQGNRPMMVLTEGRDSITDISVINWEIGAASVDGRVRWYDVRMGLCVVDVVGCKPQPDSPVNRWNHQLTCNRSSHVTDSELPSGLYACVIARLNAKAHGPL